MAKTNRAINVSIFIFLILLGGITLLIMLFLPNETQASCSGTVTCGRQVVQVCRDTSGATCNSGDLGCTCVDDCRLAESGSCSPAALAQCNAAAVCSVYVGVCHISGSCSWSSPPNPTPVCGNGVPETGETCLNCPSDIGACPPGLPPPPAGWQPCGSCSCTSIGIGTDPQCQINDVGACVWNPGSCGSGSGDPRVACEVDPAWIWPNGPNIYPGSLAYPCAQIKPLFDGAGLVTRINVYSTNYSVFPFNQTIYQPDADTFLELNKTYCMDTTPGFALTGGTTNLIYQVFTKKNPASPEELRCATQRQINVAAANPYFDVINTPNPFVVPIGQSISFNTQITKHDPTINITGTSLWRLNTRINIGPALNIYNPASTTADGINWTNSVWGAIGGPTGINAAVYLPVQPAFPRGGIFIYPVPGTVTVNQPPVVTIDNPANGDNVILGTNVTITATATDPDGDTITQVEFQVDDAAFPPASTDTAGPPWSAVWTVTGTGSHTIRARATDSKGGVGNWTTITVNSVDADPWFQVGKGNILSRGNITSSMPTTAGSSFILDDPFTLRPGIAVFSGSLSTGLGTLSSLNWKSNTNTLSNVYTYEYFENLASGKNFNNLPANTAIVTGTISSSSLDGDYAYIRINGDANFGDIGGSPQVNVNKKVIIFVNGNVRIYDKANLNAGSGNNFLMIVSRNNINIDPTLSSSNANDPILHGFYFANGSFNTGTNGVDDGMCVIKGSVVAGSINLQRDMNVENYNTPAETIIYDPEIAINFPSALSRKRLIWREVAP